MSNFMFNTDGVDENSKGDFKPFPEGEYDGLLISAEATISKNSGNPMIVWDFQAINSEGQKRIIKHYTVISKEEKLAFHQSQIKKILIICDALKENEKLVDLQELVESGELDNSPILLELKEDEYTNKDGEVRKNNKIVGFNEPRKEFAEVAATFNVSKEDDDDDLPF